MAPYPALKTRKNIVTYESKSALRGQSSDKTFKAVLSLRRKGRKERQTQKALFKVKTCRLFFARFAPLREMHCFVPACSGWGCLFFVLCGPSVARFLSIAAIVYRC
jgi:hypothetical protein